MLRVEYSCDLCNYKTNRKSCYEKHVVTTKHHMTVANNIEDKKREKGHSRENDSSGGDPIQCQYCGKEYSTKKIRTKHEKLCSIVFHEQIILNNDDKNKLENECIPLDMLKDLIEQNAKLMKMLTETKTTPTNITHNTVNNTTNNNTTNTTVNATNNFNLHVFLNEECKDAMNLMEFVDSLKYRLEDLERIGKTGFVEGISNMMIEGLKGLAITQRPIHCTDNKRDSVYVKDNDEWQKDTNKEKICNAIKYVANNNFKRLPAWKDKHPEHNNLTSTTHRTYMKIVNEASGGGTDEEDERNFKKIIKRVAAETVIDKNVDM